MELHTKLQVLIGIFQLLAVERAIPISIDKMIEAEQNVFYPRKGVAYSDSGTGNNPQPWDNYRIPGYNISFVLYQGDILIPKKEYEEVYGTRSTPTRRKRYIRERMWPDKTIPYLIEKDFNIIQREKIRYIMEYWEQNTCLEFVDYNLHRATHYIYISKRDRGCYSGVGKQYLQDKTIVNLSDGCFKKYSMLIHELGHAIGLQHEHQRSDRNRYIKINWKNIVPSRQDQFHTLKGADQFYRKDIRYDFLSVMHYGRDFFAKDGKDTIEPKRPYTKYLDKMGEVAEASDYDFKYVNMIYECNGTWMATTKEWTICFTFQSAVLSLIVGKMVAECQNAWIRMKRWVTRRLIRMQVDCIWDLVVFETCNENLSAVNTTLYGINPDERTYSDVDTYSVCIYWRNDSCGVHCGKLMCNDFGWSKNWSNPECITERCEFDAKWTSRFDEGPYLDVDTTVSDRPHGYKMDLTCKGNENISSFMRCERGQWVNEVPDCWDCIRMCKNNSRHVCLTHSEVCDEIPDCDDSTDEGGLCNATLCSSNPCPHPRACHPTPEGFVCACPPGQKLKADNATCIPAHKLCDQWGICGQQCELDSQTVKGYRCTCFDGFCLESDGLTCTLLEKEPLFVVYTSGEKLWRVDVESDNRVVLKSGLDWPYYLDFYHKNGSTYLFWTDLGENKIYRGKMTGNSVTETEPIITSGLGYLNGLAVDWVGENIYWMDSYYKRIEAANLDGSSRSTVISDNMSILRAIVVDPLKGWLFWTDADKKNPRIERSSMSGGDRRIIYTISRAEGGGEPYGLTADYNFKRLYWTDERSDSIQTIKYEGTDHRLILKGHKYTQSLFDVCVFGNYIYWTDVATDSVVRANKFTGRDVMVVQNTSGDPSGVTVIHITRTCSTPTIRNAELYRWPKMNESYCKETFVTGQTIRVICNEGFVIANSQSRDYTKQLTCVDGEWDSEVSCKADGCLGSDAKIPFVKRNKLYSLGEVIRDLRCDPGQRLVGNDSSLVCRGGIWLGDVSCEKITKNKYRIRVETGNGGTNGGVFLKLFGEYGESEEVELKDDLDHSRDKFERGDTDVFSELLTDVGQIRSISVRHADYQSRYWSLATVVIFDHARKQYYPFYWNDWVYDRKEKMKQITIYPNRDGRLCGDTFTNAILLRVPKKNQNTTARDSVGCKIKCAEIEDCAAAVFQDWTKECFWLSTKQYTSTVDATPDDPHFEYVYVRKWCQ